MMRVLITGASGQLGQHLVPVFRETKWLELLCPNRQELDIADAEQVRIYFQKHNPDLVINAAAYTAVDNAELHPLKADKINHIGAANLASASANINAAIIHISTDYVFSGEAHTPYIESDVVSPINVYGYTKLAGEKAVAHLNSKHLILRTAWLFGGLGKNFYLTIVQLLKAQNKITVVNDQYGAPTYVGDLVAVILSAVRELHARGEIDWGIYHYSGYPYVTWFDFAKAIQHSLRGDLTACEIWGVSTTAYSVVAKRPHYSCLNSTKACEYFAVKPSAWLHALDQLALNSSALANSKT